MDRRGVGAASQHADADVVDVQMLFDADRRLGGRVDFLVGPNGFPLRYTGLQHGDKAKVTLWFRGREMRHQDLGLKLLERVEADLDELAKVEQFPKLEGRRMSMVLTPRK